MGCFRHIAIEVISCLEGKDARSERIWRAVREQFGGGKGTTDDDKGEDVGQLLAKAILSTSGSRHEEKTLDTKLADDPLEDGK